ncbi:MAG: GntR family transcriptional regulator [Clostridiales bacterium]|nr:GntR family transcriptional regulator [Clostridiales bacterium]
MEIIISNASNQPIYEQIYSQIKNLIVSGKLVSGELLPSIRSLAKDLRISVITTKRAYDELEKDGYIYTVASKGSYVAQKNMEIIKEQHLKEIEEYMGKIAKLAPACRLSEDDLIEMLKIIYNEK